MLRNTNKTCKKAFTLVTFSLLATTLLFASSDLKAYAAVEDSDKTTEERLYGNRKDSDKTTEERLDGNGNENEQAEIDFGNSATSRMIDVCDTSPTDNDRAYIIPPCATHNIA
ncbi:MAG: hypothetical protein ACFB2X_25145 [Rivularia sp. (in: cyanobacteria)]